MRTLAAIGLLSLSFSSAAAQGDGGFRLVGTFIGRGGLFASAVGPGPTQGSERFYLSYLYEDSTLEVIGVDPDTGDVHVFQNPAKGEFAARCMVTGPDGNLYLGTYPHGHFLELVTQTEELVDLGAPCVPEEQFIWSVTFGSDGKLYGGTYPHAKLVRFDPNSGLLEDLGRMDPVEEYAHYLAASDDGYIYVGIGTSKANIAAYRIATGEHREILRQEFQVSGQAGVYRGNDGKVYGSVGANHFRLEGWNATRVTEAEASRPFYQNRLQDGRRVVFHGRALQIIDPATKQSVDRPFSYAGRELKLFRICLGPDGSIYGSTELPAYLVRIKAPGSVFDELGSLGSGEIYSLLFHGDRMLMAGYGTAAPLMAYDPAKPFDLENGDGNPQLLHFRGFNEGWRPKAIIEGPDGKVFVGSDAGYGRLGGMLIAWDQKAGTVTGYQNPVRDQSLVGLAVAGKYIVGGTSVIGGGEEATPHKKRPIFSCGILRHQARSLKCLPFREVGLPSTT